MTTTTQLGFDAASFEAFLEGRREPDWLVQLRRAAWQRFESLSWPARNHEEWIRTDIRTLKLDRYRISRGPSDEETGSLGLLAEGVPLAGQVRSLDGLCRQSDLDPSWAGRGVRFGSFERLLADDGDLLREALLTRAVDPTYDRFAALHAAFLSGGAVLYVPRGVVVEQPLYVQSALTDGGTDFGHLLVVLDEGAVATVLCETTGAHGMAAGLHCGAIELLVGAGANLRLVNLQNWGQGTWHFSHQRALLERDASLQWTVAAMGAKLAKVNQTVTLCGRGAASQVNGVLFTEGKQHLAYHTLQHHEAPGCRSDFLYKAALQDRSRTVWRGMIQVDPRAQQTDGYQRNDNLLLSDRARADSIPGLEIQADDVRCTHGSTSGRVDEELIFYARCRGFTKTEAIQMIVTGFFQQIFDRITIESVRRALGLAIARRVRQYE